MKKIAMNWNNIPIVYSFSCDKNQSTSMRETEHVIVNDPANKIAHIQNIVRTIPMGFLYFSPALNIKPMIGVNTRAVIERQAHMNIKKWIEHLGEKERVAEVISAFSRLVQGNYLLSKHNLFCSCYDSIGVTQSGTPRICDFSCVPQYDQYLSIEGCFYNFLSGQVDRYIVMHNDITKLISRYFSARGEKIPNNHYDKPIFDCVGRSRDDAIREMERFREKIGLFSVASFFSNIITTMSIYGIPPDVLQVITECMSQNVYDRPSSRYVVSCLNSVCLR